MTEGLGRGDSDRDTGQARGSWVERGDQVPEVSGEESRDRLDGGGVQGGPLLPT